jgi:hypothetical protein
VLTFMPSAAELKSLPWIDAATPKPIVPIIVGARSRITPCFVSPEAIGAISQGDHGTLAALIATHRSVNFRFK